MQQMLAAPENDATKRRHIGKSAAIGNHDMPVVDDKIVGLNGRETQVDRVFASACGARSITAREVRGRTARL